MAVPELISDDQCAHREVVQHMIADMMLGYGPTEDQPYWLSRHRDSRTYIEMTFGMDALELTAEYFTAHHYAPEEIITFVATEWSKTRRIMRGEEH